MSLEQGDVRLPIEEVTGPMSRDQLLATVALYLDQLRTERVEAIRSSLEAALIKNPAAWVTFDPNDEVGMLVYDLLEVVKQRLPQTTTVPRPVQWSVAKTLGIVALVILIGAALSRGGTS